MHVSCLLTTLFVCLTLLSSNQARAAEGELDSEALGIAFANAIVQRDTTAMGYLFDLNAFIEKTANIAYSKQSDIDGFKRGFLSNKPTAKVFMGQVMNEVFKEQFVVKYLKVINGRPLIRYDYVTGGHEYMFLFPKKGSDEKLLAEDMLFISRGKPFSKVLAEAAQLTTKQSSSTLKRLFDIKDVDADFARSFNKITNLVTQSKYQKRMIY